jgi:hypothetical protein
VIIDLWRVEAALDNKRPHPLIDMALKKGLTDISDSDRAFLSTLDGRTQGSCRKKNPIVLMKQPIVFKLNPRRMVRVHQWCRF